MSGNDRKGLTYTTAPFTSDVEITGHPVAHVWAGSTADDGDFFVYLEDIDPSGKSTLISDGSLRASHRKPTDPPYSTIGLPYHGSFRADAWPFTSGPNELVFDLAPTSYVIKAGRRLRVTVTGADNKNAETPILSPPPQMSIYYSPQFGSYVTLPVIPVT
jgi:putative CocE/NonD family hydrolase